ncbi:MAG TPA: hypothetical protein VFF12_18945 [Myxococcaceae bacterium]|nr:hypothetical protein [Myxococcaceae bacterium]
MSIWSDLLSLHGYVTDVHHDCPEMPRAGACDSAEAADRLRELIGTRSPRHPRPEPRGPLLGVRGLA